MVLDLGAGVGVLGLVAVRAGVRRVYMVDPQPVVKLAEKVAEKNGPADRVRCIHAPISEVGLPEKADVIISVFTGNVLLNEDLLPHLFLARDRHLAPGGVLLPDRAEIRFAPVSASGF